MKVLAILSSISLIVGYNVFLAQRDDQLFKAYDKACANQPSHPNCIYEK